MEKINIYLYYVSYKPFVTVNQMKLILTRFRCFIRLFLAYCIAVPDEEVCLKGVFYCR
jgi:hypothetical protein